jgi:hypothetical protein
MYNISKLSAFTQGAGIFYIRLQLHYFIYIPYTF